MTAGQFNLPHFDIGAEIATERDLGRNFNIAGIPIPRTLVHFFDRDSEVVNPFPTGVFPRLSATLLNYHYQLETKSDSSPVPRDRRAEWDRAH